MISPVVHRGKVILAGAGCGDPELITLKAVRWLQQADVVLTDRLVSPVILDQYVRPEAERVYVGKQCRRGFSTPQQSINELMVQYAAEGKLVVRLKGGDVSIFSNILDELETLVAHGIPYEIVPGVTAALGAAAYAGIPLTARGHSTAVRFLTLYKSEVLGAAVWKELAQTDDTLVFYMSSETLDQVVQNLLMNGIADDKLLAIIGQATTPMQEVRVCRLKDYHQVPEGALLVSPTLVMIGRVVSLHERFGWQAPAAEAGEYFKPAGEKELEDFIRSLPIQHINR